MVSEMEGGCFRVEAAHLVPTLLKALDDFWRETVFSVNLPKVKGQAH